VKFEQLKSAVITPRDSAQMIELEEGSDPTPANTKMSDGTWKLDATD
jgi:hypothetical protein